MTGLAALRERPGFWLRRAHQIGLSVFAEECRAVAVTTTQYGVLVAVGDRPGLDQATLAGVLGLDRSTTGLVVGLLDRRGLLQRARDPQDQRRWLLCLTPDGARLLHDMAPAAERARTRLLAPLDAQDSRILLALLRRLAEHHNATARVPLMEDA